VRPDWIELLRSDVCRITGRSSTRDVVWNAIAGETFRYNVAMRFAATRRSKPGRLLARVLLRRQRLRLGINIPAQTAVGPGLLIGHAGGIVVNAAASIGSDCNLSHNVTIGTTRGPSGGVPTIGNRVYIGPGAIIIGNIVVGDDVAVGANAVVLHDVPSGMTVVGNPGRAHPGGSRDYVNRVSVQS
jgi:serine O-acetyltransferase